jgi:hypothetical protein
MTTTINNRKKWNKNNITINLPILEKEDINDEDINDEDINDEDIDNEDIDNEDIDIDYIHIHKNTTEQHSSHKIISRWRLKTHKFINQNIHKHTKKHYKTL